jgi:cytochrome c oxidase subunit 3
MGIGSVKAYRLPLLNTLILILSGITLTISHKSLLIGEMVNAKIRLIFTILLGIVFECLQLIEYSLTAFNFNDMVYGNIFYFLTGLHGFHVFVGIIFLIVCLYRLQKGYMVSKSHTGYEFAI